MDLFSTLRRANTMKIGSGTEFGRHLCIKVEKKSNLKLRHLLQSYETLMQFKWHMVSIWHIFIGISFSDIMRVRRFTTYYALNQPIATVLAAPRKWADHSAGQRNDWPTLCVADDWWLTRCVTSASSNIIGAAAKYSLFSCEFNLLQDSVRSGFAPEYFICLEYVNVACT